MRVQIPPTNNHHAWGLWYADNSTYLQGSPQS